MRKRAKLPRTFFHDRGFFVVVVVVSMHIISILSTFVIFFLFDDVFAMRANARQFQRLKFLADRFVSLPILLLTLFAAIERTFASRTQQSINDWLLNYIRNANLIEIN